MNKVTVEWFDENKGIGEGFNEKGDTIFLNYIYIEADKEFLTLKKDEVILCSLLKSPEGNYYASKIKRGRRK